MRKILLTATLLGGIATNANAYYDTKDNPEFIMIQANQSAFAIPVVGDNKATQTNFGSKKFLDDAKVAAKRYMVPHMLVRNANWGTYDYYVPSVLLILVDRTPYMREWTDATDRGTSTKKEGFQFQSKEGITISAGVSIGAMVKEEDAATFLYWFGTKNQPATSDIAGQFSSVSQGKSLSDIMDTVVRGYVQATLSQHFMKHSFADGNANASAIMEEIKTDVTKHFAERGITIDYVGYSGTLVYSDTIQKSIDEVYVASQKAASSAAMMPALPYMNAQADVNIKVAAADAMRKWNGAVPYLPSTVVTVGNSWIDSILNFVGITRSQDKK